MKLKANYLLLIASSLWLIPGIIVFKKGIMTNFGVWDTWRIIGAISVFLIFQFIIFRKMVTRHITRIKSYNNEKRSITNTFDKKTYLIMLFFITLGIVLSITKIAPATFVAFFYPGIGLALFIAGVKFLIAYFR